ncbi:MAG TPA: nuclear transport factor 2 family protein [Planctomycetota bacterium]
MLRHLPILFLGVAAWLSAGCSTPRSRSNTDHNLAAAAALDQAFVAAFNRADATAISSMYWNSPDAVSFPPDALQARGHAAIHQATLQSFAAMPGARLELTESHQVPAGDSVVGWGLWRITMPAPDGSTVEMIGRYTDLKAMRNGKWVYLIDHASAPLPAEQ